MKQTKNIVREIKSRSLSLLGYAERKNNDYNEENCKLETDCKWGKTKNEMVGKYVRGP